jgi:S1-C subfamily serine protease
MRMILRGGATFGMALALAGMSMAPAQAAAPDKLYSMLAPSVWRVIAVDKDKKPFAQGSAVVIAPEILLTNCHVLKGARGLLITQSNVMVLARLQYADPERDMCQIVARNLRAPAVRMGDSDRLVVGQRIYTLGTPMNLELTLSDGLVSALRRDGQDRLRFIQISAPISHGSSGGGLFDEEGRLIGITSAGLDNGQNLNLAIPIKWQRDLASRSRAALASDSPIVRAADLPPADGVPSEHALAVPSAPATAPAASPDVDAHRPSSGFVHAVAPVPSGYAKVTEIDKVLALDPSAAKTYEKFLQAPFPRAFALAAGGGSWHAWSDKPKVAGDDPDPAVRVLTGCEEHFQRKCTLYAVDDVVVYHKPDSRTKR